MTLANRFDMFFEALKTTTLLKATKYKEVSYVHKSSDKLALVVRENQCLHGR